MGTPAYAWISAQIYHFLAQPTPHGQAQPPQNQAQQVGQVNQAFHRRAARLGTAGTRAGLERIVLLSVGRKADFEFHVSNWLGGGGDGLGADRSPA